MVRYNMSLDADSRAWYNHGNTLYGLGRYEGAIARYERILYGFRFTNPYYFQPPSTSESEYVDESAEAS